MEPFTVNYWAVVTGAVISMVIGGIWYGPLFGKKWAEIIGADNMDQETRKKMQKAAMPFYLVQFLLTLYQVFILAHFIPGTNLFDGMHWSVLIWSAFVIPTLAGAVMWTNEPGRLKWARFLIQGGYQLILFAVFGLLLAFWK
jgi:hypothetical protein